MAKSQLRSLQQPLQYEIDLNVVCVETPAVGLLFFIVVGATVLNTYLLVRFLYSIGSK